jgi:hypothetical protein
MKKAKKVSKMMASAKPPKPGQMMKMGGGIRGTAKKKPGRKGKGY